MGVMYSYKLGDNEKWWDEESEDDDNIKLYQILTYPADFTVCTIFEKLENEGKELDRNKLLNTSYIQTALEADYFMEPEFNLKRELVMMLGGYFSTSFIFLQDFSIKLKFGVLGNPKKSYSLKKFSTAIFVGKNLYSPQENFSPYAGVILSNSAKTYIFGIGKAF